MIPSTPNPLVLSSPCAWTFMMASATHIMTYFPRYPYLSVEPVLTGDFASYLLNQHSTGTFPRDDYLVLISFFVQQACWFYLDFLSLESSILAENYSARCYFLVSEHSSCFYKSYQFILDDLVAKGYCQRIERWNLLKIPTFLFSMNLGS